MTPFRSRPEPERREGLSPNGLPWESVWDYPRPPEIRPEAREVTVSLNGETIARSDRAVKVCETAGGPVVYLPPEDVTPGALEPSGGGGSFCEWKGSATYFDVVAGGERIPQAAWAYPDPTPSFQPIAGWVSFYPALVECSLDDERVRPQPGGFYGGWITDEIAGPIKGEPGSEGW
ncbi:MAG: DUF427 domain-containing protein [Solirubrobacterales bacterium]